MKMTLMIFLIPVPFAYEDVEKLRNVGLAQGGSLENAIVLKIVKF